MIALLKSERSDSRLVADIADTVIGVFNHAEGVSYFVHIGAPLKEVGTMLGALPMRVVGADDDLGRVAGEPSGIASKAGLSLGDRFSLALAKQMSVADDSR